MSFLKRHYEKIILAFLLIVFVVALVLQIGILLQARSVTLQDLRIPPKAPDYTRINPKDPKYDVMSLLVGNDSKWAQGKARVPEDAIFTDLCIPMSLSRCPNPNCERFIPFAEFPPPNSAKIGHCPFCDFALPAPEPDVKPPNDSDQDGIPDDVEIANGLNPNDPSDAQKDLDNDGFTNLEEYQNGTDMKDPKSRPSSYAKKLYVVEIVKKKLNMSLTKIIARGEDKAKWEIHMEVLENGRKRTRFYSLGNIIKSDDGDFKILDIIPEFKTVFNENIKAPEEINLSKIVLQKLGAEDRIVAEIGREISEPREKITMLYGVTNKQITLYQGDAITLGDEASGIEKFVAISSNPATKTVQLKREDGQIFEIKPILDPSAPPQRNLPGNE